mmetsp:Transcript_139550/g.445323  ORF Transcript_139550/g.445323 Transcript_139550/m.445323 type:complete len:244 (+) Transcript_139550:204-935(+)
MSMCHEHYTCTESTFHMDARRPQVSCCVSPTAPRPATAPVPAAAAPTCLKTGFDARCRCRLAGMAEPALPDIATSDRMGGGAKTDSPRWANGDCGDALLLGEPRLLVRDATQTRLVKPDPSALRLFGVRKGEYGTRVSSTDDDDDASKEGGTANPAARDLLDKRDGDDGTRSPADDEDNEAAADARVSPKDDKDDDDAFAEADAPQQGEGGLAVETDEEGRGFGRLGSSRPNALPARTWAMYS